MAGFWIGVVDAEPAELGHLTVGTAYRSETTRGTYGHANSGREEGTTAHDDHCSSNGLSYYANEMQADTHD